VIKMNFNQRIRKYRECGSKIKQETREDAEKARIFMEEDTGVRFNVYLCPWCHKYHIGRKDENLEKKKWRKQLSRLTGNPKDYKVIRHEEPTAEELESAKEILKDISVIKDEKNENK